MPRKRKITDENNLLQIAETSAAPASGRQIEAIATTPAPAPAPLMARQSHTIVTKFQKEVPIDEAADKAANITDESEDEYDFLDDDDDDKDDSSDQIGQTTNHDDREIPPHIAKFLDQMGGTSDRWTMVAYRLPTYDKDQRTDPAKRKLCGTMEFTESYEEEVQRRWARERTPNHFLVLVKRNGIYVKGGTLPPFSCEPAQPAERINSSDSSAGALEPAPAPQYPIYFEQPAPPAPPQKSGLALIKEYLEGQKLVAQYYGLQPGLGANTQAPAPAPAIDPEVEVLRLIAKDDEAMRRISSQLVGKLFSENGAVERDPWAEVAMRVVESGQLGTVLQVAVAALMKGFGNLMQPMAPAPGPAAPAPGPAPIEAPAAQPAQPSQALEQAPAPGADSEQPTEFQVLGLVLEHARRRLPARVAADRVLAVSDHLNNNSPGSSIDAYLKMLIDLAPADALQMAVSLHHLGAEVAALEDAEAWTAQFQGFLREAFAEGENADE